jgi:hypothetical protein
MLLFQYGCQREACRAKVSHVLGVIALALAFWQPPTWGQSLGTEQTQGTGQIQLPAQNQRASDRLQDPKSTPAKAADKFNQDFAFSHLEAICEIGPRISATAGMVAQQKLLQSHFESVGGSVTYQRFNVNDPRTGNLAELQNMIVRWHPEREKRLMFCCHYDTRPFPDRDPVNPQGVFIGANDGGSGAALLCELGRHIQNMEGPYGIDFVFFDGEEFVFLAKRDPMFLGSQFFANQYAAGRHDVKYVYAILVDMIGDADLQLPLETNSLKYARKLTRSIWDVARQLKVREFMIKKGHAVRDDHLPLNEIAGIPTCDIIDFDYPNPRFRNQYWHTTQDTIDKCSADSLGKVGMVLLEWSRQMQALNSKQKKKTGSKASARTAQQK